MSLITLALAKSRLRVDGTGDDDLIQLLIDGAEDWIERGGGIPLSYQTFTEFHSGGGFRLVPHMRPVRSVTSIYDQEAAAAVDSSVYELRGNVIVRIDGGRWPHSPGRWKITYEAGYIAADVPVNIKLAILSLVSRAYNNPDGKTGEGAAGWSGSWASLADSDIMKLLSIERIQGV